MKNSLINVIFAIVVATIVGVIAYFETNGTKEGQCEQEEIYYGCSCPPVVYIYLQPLGSYTQAEALQLESDLEKHIYKDGTYLNYNIEVLPPKPLSKDMLNESKNRYSAAKVLAGIKRGGEKECYIGLMHEDISIPKGDYPDWGIQGLSYLGQHRGVVSTFRLKGQLDQMWKVVYHEFCHAFFNLPHCPADRDTCIIRDGHGKPYWRNKRMLCEDCLEKAHETI